MQKLVEELLYSNRLSHIHCPNGYSFGMVSVGTLSIFEKLDFSFYISYCHMKTAPPMKTFDFFHSQSSKKIKVI